MVIGAHETQHGGKRRERVGRNLWTRSRQAPEQTRLAGIGQTNERSIGKQMQIKAKTTNLPGFTVLVEVGDAPTGRKGSVSTASTASACRDEARPRRREISKQYSGIVTDHGANRYGNEPVLALVSTAVIALSVRAALGTLMRVKVVFEQSTHGRRSHKQHVAPPASVAAVRTAARTVLLSVKGRDPIAAIACGDLKGCFVT